MKGRNICEQESQKTSKTYRKNYHIHDSDCGSYCLFVSFYMDDIHSFKETSDIYKMPPSLLPANPTLENFIEGWKGADFGMFFQNSAVVTFLATIGTVFSSSVVAYGFARFKSRLSPVLFMILLGTMMLPSQVTLIPQYLLYYKLGMVDTFWPLIIPSWLGGGAFNIFLLFSSLERFRRNWMKRLRLMGRIPGRYLRRYCCQR